jgi:hypothetical protein
LNHHPHSTFPTNSKFELIVMQFKLLAFVAAATAVIAVPAVPAISPTRTAAAATPTFSQSIRDDNICLAFRSGCNTDSNYYWFNKLNCVLLFTCGAPFYDVRGVINEMLWSNKGPFPEPTSLPRLSVNVST